MPDQIIPRNHSDVPGPVSTSKRIQGPADDSWKDFHKRGSDSPAEAITNDPRKNPVSPGAELAKTTNPAKAGRIGGRVGAKKLGSDFVAERGSKGGTITRMIHGSAFFGHIARLRWAKERAKL